ncbi:shikimate kinase [Pelagicoccus albus]|uniref:Shikimate kinase n=1 Tax=Pelagicoccus albus TaxID=415222 RepID=A0A7X1B7P8_9BACT|nr:shikimate kinase [Pelagicoccus albus]MBC2605925.1 shikimate kinase [Pelagicoccus albus]
MLRILVFGNSGSGKSTFAKNLACLPEVAHLDLDSIAWKPNQPGVRETLHLSFEAIDTFISEHSKWVIEGCYSSLLEYAADSANSMVFLNPGVKACQSNCRNRPWEPHKYSSPAAQDKNLTMLLDWVASYESKDDEFSLQQHQMLFDSFDGKKYELKSNSESKELLQSLKSTYG